jgi:F-type H+-transporting ATPase subunit epsilon
LQNLPDVMKTTMHLTILTPDKELFNSEVVLVQFPGTEGSFEVLHNHARMIATLTAGSVRVVDHVQATHHVEIKGGVVEVRDNNILVLAS